MCLQITKNMLLANIVELIGSLE